MLMNQLAQKYAQAVYELAAEKGSLDAVEQQLQLVADTLINHADLATLIYHPRVQAEAKKQTLSKVFDGSVDAYVHNFLLLLVDKRRETLLPAIITEYIQMANQARNIAEADVITALPLTEAEQAALIQKLSTVTGKTMRLKVVIDAKIIGGIIVKIGDKLIDGSVARQLKSLEAILRKGELTKIGVTN